mmetsp:Transcript_1793/g.2700  ORF Transcript_1793/g.2700 Transcript_1793/m.2700 type:complete len:297 (-) Transcript_1793:169-1059(-)
MADIQESVDTTLGSAAENIVNTKVMDPLKDEVTSPAAPTKSEIWTPEPSSDKPTAGKESAGDMKSYLQEIALWEQPMLSAKVLGALVLVYYMTCCGQSLIGVLCYFLFWRLLIVAGPRLAAEKLNATDNGMVKKVGTLLNSFSKKVEAVLKLPSAEQVSFVVSGAASVVEEKTFAAADAIEKAGKDVKMLKACMMHLLGAMFILRFISLYNILFFGLFFALTVPAIYNKQKDRIDPLLEKLKGKAQPHVEKAKVKAEELLKITKAKAEEVQQKAMEKIKEIRAKRAGAEVPATAEE